MRRFDDSRYADRLAEIERIAEPHLDALGLAGVTVEPRSSFGLVIDEEGRVLRREDEHGDILDRASSIPDVDARAVRLALLRDIAESDIGTADSVHGRIRASLATRAPLDPHDLALELALCRFGSDLGFGVGLTWMRLTLLDPTLAELDGIGATEATADLVDEAEQLAELMTNDTMIMDASSTDRRFRLLLFLQRSRQGILPASAFDPGDPFGQSMRAIAETDDGLARALGTLLPLAAKATTVTPDRGQRSRIAAVAADPGSAPEARSAVTRSVQQLLTAPLTVRGPGFVTVRPSNQRLGRVAIWSVPALLPDRAADVLGDVGVRLGTSGKRDNQARDTAIANTCAALLGEMDDDEAVASLARMLARVRNKPVRKQIEKALAAAAERSGIGVDALIDRSLPTYGFDADGRRPVEVGTWTAEIGVDGDGRVRATWSDEDGDVRDDPPSTLREQLPGDVADVAQLVDEIRATLADERQRLERLLSDERRWSVAGWRKRFIDHPIGRVHGRRLIWRFSGPTGTFDALPTDEGLTDISGVSVQPLPGATVELWHPIEAPPEDVDRWRDRLVERQAVQPFKQAFRETYTRHGDTDAVMDASYADRPLAYGQMRALMGARGWTAPMLGPFDQGDRSVSYRDFPRFGVRAELGHVPAGIGDPRERVEFARSGALRFTVGTDDRRSPVLLVDVPPRVLSEVLRDVDLFTSVPDPMRRPFSSTDTGGSPSVATRADALRRITPLLPFARNVSALGLWLRVESGPDAWAISLATGEVVRLPEEEAVKVKLPDSLADVGYLPFEDEILRKVLATAATLLGRA